MSVASRWAGQGPGGARPPGGAGGVLEVTGGGPDELAAGNGSRGRWGGIRLFQVRPMDRVIRCGQCRWLQSSLRVSPAGAGGHGAVRVRGGGQAGSIKTAPAPPVRG